MERVPAGRRGWGRIQYSARDSALVIPADMIHYAVTKTALLGVSHGFAKEAAGSGVTVNSVIAGSTHTGGVEDFVRSLVGDLPWDQGLATRVGDHRCHRARGRRLRRRDPPVTG